MNTHATLFIRISLALAVLGCCSSLFAEETKTKPMSKPVPKKTVSWGIDWQWEVESPSPVLRLTITNKNQDSVELSDWKFSGKNAKVFSFKDEKDFQKITLAPGASADIEIAWRSNTEPDPKFNASFGFTHNLPGVEPTYSINLCRPASHLPYQYRIKGFVDRENRPVPRDAQGRIVVDDGYHDGAMVEKLLATFAEDYPNLATMHTIGKTWQGRKIPALRITSKAKPEREKPAMLFVAAHHANEILSTEILLDIIHQLTTGYATDPEIRRWVDQYEIWCVPVANPDGLYCFFHVNGYGRKNGRDNNNNGRIDDHDGVDLNRNYPFRWHSLGEKGSSGNPNHGRYRGPTAGSEPETQAIMRLADRERFVMLITYHTSGSRILVPYTIDKVRNPHPDAAWIVGAHMAALSDTARADRDYMPVRNLYSVDGVDQDWHYWRHGTLAFLWEGPRNISDPPERKAMIAGARPGWQYQLRRLMAGPTVSGRILDAVTGQPLEAVVSIDEIKTFEKEVHTSHPETGRFDRVLPIEGVYHVRVEKEGYQPETVEVRVGHEWKKICVRLSPEANASKK